MHSLKIIPIQNKPLAPGPPLPPPPPPGSPSMAYTDTEPLAEIPPGMGGNGDPRAWGAHREGGMLPILPTNAHPSSLSCPQGGLGDGGRDPGDPWDLWGSEAGDPQNLSRRRPGRVGERNSQRMWRGMISAPLPSPGTPRSSAHPKTCKFPGKDPSRWIPAKGGRSSSTIQGASSSFPPLGGERNRSQRNLGGLEGAAHTPAQAGKGKCQQGGHGGGDGSIQDTPGESEGNSDREQRGRAGVGGRLISASSSKEK